ncbi:MAG TPA: hypothetical protein VH079_09325 [Terriglobales bacterium]|nr:hypothetical protein [Terriglobales bacterium]
MNERKIGKARVTKRRDVRIHADLWHTANCLLDAGQRDIKASAHQFRASLIFRAFYLEAFLNWLGQHLIPHWSYLERLNPREKLDLLNDLIHVTPNYGAPPWQIVKDLFGFRNYLAHGKPESSATESMEALDEYLDEKLGRMSQTEWERFGTEGNAVKAKEDIEKIATLLYKKAKVKHDGPLGPFSFGFQIHSAQL